MFSESIQQRPVSGGPWASVRGCSIKSTSGASLGGGVVVARSGASAEQRVFNQRGTASIVSLARELSSAGLRFAARGSVARGRVTYNYAFERTVSDHGFVKQRRAAAQRGR